MFINAFTNATVRFLSYTSRIHAGFQVSLILKIWILVFCITRQRDKEVFYLMKLSTATIIHGMWYNVGGMITTKENRGDGKVKVHPGHRPRRHRGGTGIQLYSFFNLGARGAGWPTPRPAALPPGKTRYPLCRRLGGPQGQCERVRKFWPSRGFDPRTVQPVASRYIDWAIPVHGKPKYSKKYLSQCHYGIGSVIPDASFIYIVITRSNVVFMPNLGESFQKITSYFRWWDDGGMFCRKFLYSFIEWHNAPANSTTLFTTIEVTTSNNGHHSVQKPTVCPHPPSLKREYQ